MIKISIGFLLLTLFLSIKGFSQSDLKFDPKRIICSDQIEISDGYFFLIRNHVKKDYGGEDLTAFNAPYFISSSNANIYSVDNIYKNCYHFADTAKYLSFTPKLNSYLNHLLGSGHCTLYIKGINISDSINPKIFYKVKPRDKYHKGDQLGFCYVKIKWLHLKMPDYIATSCFDYPYTLSQPFAKTKIYDIYIPIELLQINNKVIIKKRKIVLINSHSDN